MNNFEFMMALSVAFFWLMLFITANLGILAFYFSQNPTVRSSWNTREVPHKNYSKVFWYFMFSGCTLIFSFILMLALTN